MSQREVTVSLDDTSAKVWLVLGRTKIKLVLTYSSDWLSNTSTERKSPHTIFMPEVAVLQPSLVVKAATGSAYTISTKQTSNHSSGDRATTFGKILVLHHKRRGWRKHSPLKEKQNSWGPFL